MMPQNIVITIFKGLILRVAPGRLPRWEISVALCRSHPLSPVHNCWVLLLFSASFRHGLGVMPLALLCEWLDQSVLKLFQLYAS